LPSVGLAISATVLMALALLAPALTRPELIAALALISCCTGTAMPVAQMTVQVVAGPKFLGAAAASIQFSRSVGAVFGTALVGAVLFALLAAQDPHTASGFADLVERGPQALEALTTTQRGMVETEIANAFRGAFLTIACFTTSGMLLAWWLPVRRI
jgi:hypothetical protein